MFFNTQVAACEHFPKKKEECPEFVRNCSASRATCHGCAASCGHMPLFDPRGLAGQTLEGSFSAVSTPIYARKYVYMRSFQILQHFRMACLISVIFQNDSIISAKFSVISPNFMQESRWLQILIDVPLFFLFENSWMLMDFDESEAEVARC